MNMPQKNNTITQFNFSLYLAAMLMIIERQA